MCEQAGFVCGRRQSAPLCVRCSFNFEMRQQKFQLNNNTKIWLAFIFKCRFSIDFLSLEAARFTVNRIQHQNCNRLSSFRCTRTNAKSVGAKHPTFYFRNLSSRHESGWMKRMGRNSIWSHLHRDVRLFSNFILISFSIACEHTLSTAPVHEIMR